MSEENKIQIGFTALDEVPQDVKDEVSNFYQGKVSYEKYGQPCHKDVKTYKLETRTVGDEQVKKYWLETEAPGVEQESLVQGPGRPITLWHVRLEHADDSVNVYQFLGADIFSPNED